MAQGGLPFLPGMSFPDPRARHHKSQAFKVEADGRRTCDELAPGIGGQAVSEEQRRALEESKPATTTADLHATRRKEATTAGGYVASWEELHDGVLRFEAYVREEAPTTTYGNRILRCLVSFWLADDSLAVASLDHATGHYQGSLLKRGRVPRAGGPAKQHITADMLNVGEVIDIHGRRYTLINCDGQTASLLASLGTTVPPPLELPPDPSADAKPATTAQAPLVDVNRAPGRKRDPLRQFIENEKKVLRWFAVWDARGTPNGELRRLELLYFLADDTLEIQENRDEARERGVTSTRFLAKQTPPAGFPKPEELAIGKRVLVNARELLITDMDPFTRRWFTEATGITEFNPITVTDFDEDVPAAQQRGRAQRRQQETAAAGEVKGAVQRRLEAQGKQLAFVAHFADPADRQTAERSFSLAMRLANESLVVIEAAQRDMAGGKFFDSQEPVKSPSGTPYRPADLFVGARITVSGRVFVLDSATEWTLRWMEAHPSTWPQSDLDKVLRKLAATEGLVQALSAKKKGDDDDMVDADMLREALAPAKLTPQEFLTVQRRYSLDPNKPKLVHFPSLVSQLAQQQNTQ